MKTRVFGTEIEYALVFSSTSKSDRSSLDTRPLLERMEDMSSLLAEALKSSGRPVAGQFLGNGGRYYVDRGAHPEYATPECSSVRQLVAHEKAGDRIVRELVRDADRITALQGRPERLRLFKNNVDAWGNTYGSHENYLITPRAMERIGLIIPFLVTRQVFAGAGKVVANGAGDVPFQVTQRADFIERVYSDRTRETRGIINLRKRELPRYGQNLRLHILVGDANLSEHAIALKVGTTALVLRLIEETTDICVPGLDAPVDALKTVSRFPNRPVKLVGGKRSYTAVDVQTIYLEKLLNFFQNQERSAEEDTILRWWSSTLDGLTKLKLSEEDGLLLDDPGDLHRRLDWVLKLWLLNRVRASGRLGARDSRLRLLDISYHELDPETGLFERCESLGLVDRLLEEADICRAMHEPPRDTRAWLRGMIIQCLANANVDVDVRNWELIRIVAGTEDGTNLHPFKKLSRTLNRLDIKLEDPLLSDDASIVERLNAFSQTCSVDLSGLTEVL